MPPLSAAVFGDELRRLDTPAFARFVADLWEAGGWDTEADPPVVYATRRDRSPGSQTILLSHRGTGRQATDIDPDLVVTSRRAARTETAAGVPIVDAEDLHQRAVYGIDREDYAALCRRYFDRDGFVAPPSESDSPGALATLFQAVRTRASAPGVVLVVTVLLLTGSVIAVSMAGPSDQSATADTTPAATSTPATTPVRQTETPSLWYQQYANVGCPPPPRDAHPSELRPSISTTASSNGLDAWELVSAGNASEPRGPNALAVPVEPQARHVASYRSPGDDVYQIVIDHWESYPQAVQVATQMTSTKPMILVWGRYTIMVEGYSPNGTRLSEPAVNMGALPLLGAVSAPDGAQLTQGCAARITIGDARSELQMVPPVDGHS